MDKKNRKYQIFLIGIFIIICSIVLYPFLLLVSASFSRETDVIFNGFKLIPEHFDLSAYKYVFNNPTTVLNAYKVTITFSIVSMVLSTLLNAMIAYPLSSSKFRGKKQLSFYLFFTMLFHGGLVPSYILITQYLHLNDTIWVYILPTLISPWHVFMMRTFFADIPTALIESMKIDGASEFKIFLTLIIPLSKPVIATVALLHFLSKWNDWYTSMLYINDQGLISLQYLLQKILRDIDFMSENTNTFVELDISKIPTTTVQMAMAMIVAGPAMFVFPFFQKYFVKGLTVGSVKG